MQIGVIGGGAAGMAAAIAAARGGANVVILEKNDRVGKKILVTGNGKCNLSNLSFSADCYYSREREKAFAIASRFPPKEAIAFFEGLGLLLKEKNGYLYPACEQASAVLDVLRHELSALKVRILTGETVQQISAGGQGGGYIVKTENNNYEFERLIVACGGKASPKTGSDGSGYLLLQKLGMKTVPIVPALVQLRCQGSFFKALAGIRCEAELTLKTDGERLATERGELQMTDYGISGIPVFQLSRHAAYGLKQGRQVTVSIDLLPDWEKEQLMDWLHKRLLTLKGRSAEEFMTGTVHKKWSLFFLKEQGIKPAEQAQQAAQRMWEQLFLRMKDFTVTVTDTNSFQNAQVCAGGIALSEIKETLESVRYPGLYVAGELLDVDGRCGGYNLQWAFSTGYLAGQEAGRE